VNPDREEVKESRTIHADRKHDPNKAELKNPVFCLDRAISAFIVRLVLVPHFFPNSIAFTKSASRVPSPFTLSGAVVTVTAT
jgi:hypothetical protein